MPARANGYSVVKWALAFVSLYLVSAVMISLAAGPFRHLAIWLAGATCWLTSAAFDAAPYFTSASPTPHSRSAADQARITALRWALCGLLLANAVLQVWRAFQPGDSTLHIAGLEIRLLPLDFRMAPVGVDPLALLMGLTLSFVGLSEFRLRLKALSVDHSKPSATLI